MPACKQCKKQFTIYPEDKEFYQRISIPEPTLCHDCRLQRKLSFKNERVLYKRKCDATKAEIISQYSENSPYTVYSEKYWWSDKWDPLNYGKVFNFNQTFFKQWYKLSKSVPKINLIGHPENVNSEYVNNLVRGKNCYLVFMGIDLENLLYSTWSVSTKESIDIHHGVNLELCYECIDCKYCYKVFFSQLAEKCHSSYFLYNCFNCHDCFGAVNTRNRAYIYMGKQYTEKEYKEIIKNIKAEDLSQLQKKIQQLKNKAIVPALRITRSSNCFGEYIDNCEDCNFCFDIFNSNKLKYCFNIFDAKDCHDVCYHGVNVELSYESVNGGVNSYRNLFCNTSRESNNIEYCEFCHGCQDCFGCIGLRNKKYCILNKQYEQESFDKLRMKIIEYMKKIKEYGEFFPVQYSPFPYIDSVANDYFPQAEKESKIIVDNNLPICCECGKNYKFIPQELKFYQKESLPMPKICFNCRHKKRLALRNPNKFWSRVCIKCNKKIQTTYAPDRLEIVYCEECYNKEIY